MSYSMDYRITIYGSLTGQQAKEVMQLCDVDDHPENLTFFEGAIQWHIQQMKGGVFDELENYLIENEIPFDRKTGPSAELQSDGWAVLFRPGMDEPQGVGDYKKDKSEEAAEVVSRLINNYRNLSDGEIKNGLETVSAALPEPSLPSASPARIDGQKPKNWFLETRNITAEQTDASIIRD